LVFVGGLFLDWLPFVFARGSLHLCLAVASLQPCKDFAGVGVRRLNIAGWYSITADPSGILSISFAGWSSQLMMRWLGLVVLVKLKAASSAV
jgi:hypothetical protein